jgi:hypothetical protein
MYARKSIYLYSVIKLDGEVYLIRLAVPSVWYAYDDVYSGFRIFGSNGQYYASLIKIIPPVYLIEA